METKNVLRQLRESHNLTQDQMAERLMVTRQAVSRWENGETQPNTDTLRILSKEFNVSINTLLGSPRQLICQCCGMPLEDSIIGKNKDGSLNEDYCQWCYADQYGEAGLLRRPGTLLYEADAATAGLLEEIRPTQ